MQGKAWSGTQTSLSLSFSGSVRLYKHMRSWVVSQSEFRTADRLISICETETSIVSAPSTISSHGCHRLLSVHQIYALLLKLHFLGEFVCLPILYELYLLYYYYSFLVLPLKISEAMLCFIIKKEVILWYHILNVLFKCVFIPIFLI